MNDTAPFLSVTVDEKQYSNDGHAVKIIDGIQFTVEKHELVILTGPSGCGKTTLLNIVAGLDKDYRGEIRLPANKPNTLPLSFVFQKSCLLPWRTVKQNIDLILPPNVDSKRGIELLDYMGLKHVIHHYPSSLSVGMSRRVSLARGFVVEAPLLIMDEPFSSIDELTAVRLRKLLLSLLDDSQRIVLFVTHNLREALFLGDRLIILSTRPCRILDDISLPGARNRSDDEIEYIYANITSRFPGILS